MFKRMKLKISIFLSFRNKYLIFGLTPFIFLSCKSSLNPDNSRTQFFRSEMRGFVQSISDYAKSTNPDFIVITQNGIELLTDNSKSDGKLVQTYLDKIDGVGQEHVFYGVEGYEIPTPSDYRNYLLGFLDLAESQNLKVLVTDYCGVPELVNDSFSKNNERNYISFAAPSDDFDLDEIPDYPESPFDENSMNIAKLPGAKNFLYLINSSMFSNKQFFLTALQKLNYDLLIIDPFYSGRLLKEADIQSLKTKANGGKRLVIAYLNIGAAEQFRYYWQNDWGIGNPAWIVARYSDPLYYNEYWVKYWVKDWQDIIFGNGYSFLDKILGSGFDGVYLDNLEVYAFFESL